MGEKSPVQAAMELFWQEGAEVASYGDIVAATGLSRKALYARWPGKDDLLRDALALYRRAVLGPMLGLLDKGGDAGLRAFWDALEVGVQMEGWRGCLLFRTASGPLRGQAHVAAMFEEYVGRLREGVTRAVREAGKGSLDPAHAGWQAVAIAGLISAEGARAGYSAKVAEILAAGRAACGLL